METAVAAIKLLEAGAEKLLAEGGEHAQGAHCAQRDAASDGKLKVDAVEKVAKYLLDHDVGSQKYCDGYGHQQKHIGPPFLRRAAHELRVVQASKETNGEERKQTAVENLSNEDNLYPRS